MRLVIKPPVPAGAPPDDLVERVVPAARAAFPPGPAAGPGPGSLNGNPLRAPGSVGHPGRGALGRGGQIIRKKPKLASNGVVAPRTIPGVKLPQVGEGKSRKRKEEKENGAERSKKIRIRLTASPGSGKLVVFKQNGATAKKKPPSANGKAPKHSKKGGGSKQPQNVLATQIGSILQEIERRDVSEIFKFPVTEDIAPGYFSIIDEAMDTTKMAEKLRAGEYATLASFWSDCKLLFGNAMRYNPDKTVYFQEAQLLLEMTGKLVAAASEGAIDTSDTIIAGNGTGAGSGADVAVGGNPKKKKKKKKRRMPSMSFVSGSMVSMEGPERDENSSKQAKSSLKDLIPHTNQLRETLGHCNIRRMAYDPFDSKFAFGYLTGGHNAQGQPYANAHTHLKMKPVTMENYINSIRRFVSGVSVEAKSYIMKRCAERIRPGLTRDIIEDKKMKEPGGPK